MDLQNMLLDKISAVSKILQIILLLSFRSTSWIGMTRAESREVYEWIPYILDTCIIFDLLQNPYSSLIGAISVAGPLMIGT